MHTLRVISFGAHPDDCDYRAGGIAAKYARLGHQVKFVSLSSGDAGHQAQGGGALARRRRAEAAEAGRRLGIASYITLDNHDGELLASLEVRHQIIRLIRGWQADIVLGPRPWDYHPDHRYCGIAMQDAAYLVIVPNVCPDTPALKKNPVFLYHEDGFRKPVPFQASIAIDIDDAIEAKVAAFHAHESQMYEWMPYLDDAAAEVPADGEERRDWLRRKWFDVPRQPTVQEALEKWYGQGAAAGIRYAEAFEVCEYGRQPDEAELRELFPFLAPAR
jgi:LmbE family N-acetylglucosaminyl deacetylase